MDRQALALGRLSPNGLIKEVRADHVARYRWATARLHGRVVDAGCNCGYGAAILADAGLAVTAIDIWADGLIWARAHYDRPTIDWRLADIAEPLPVSEAVVAFEVVEHLAEPRSFLRAARKAAPVLLASVPNEAVWPWQPRFAPTHHRHYRRADLAALLSECGWSVAAWWGQARGDSPVERDVNGRTLVVECR